MFVFISKKNTYLRIEVEKLANRLNTNFLIVRIGYKNCPENHSYVPNSARCKGYFQTFAKNTNSFMTSIWKFSKRIHRTNS